MAGVNAKTSIAGNNLSITSLMSMRENHETHELHERRGSGSDRNMWGRKIKKEEEGRNTNKH
jgi:hypothetical protein